MAVVRSTGLWQTAIAASYRTRHWRQPASRALRYTLRARVWSPARRQASSRDAKVWESGCWKLSCTRITVLVPPLQRWLKTGWIEGHLPLTHSAAWCVEYRLKLLLGVRTFIQLSGSAKLLLRTTKSCHSAQQESLISMPCMQCAKAVAKHLDSISSIVSSLVIGRVVHMWCNIGAMH